MVDVPITPLILGAFSFLLVVFFVFALRRARRRRFAELEEPESPASLDSPQPSPSLQPETPQSTAEAMPALEPERDLDAEPAAARDADHAVAGDEPVDETPSLELEAEAEPEPAPVDAAAPATKDDDRVAISAGLQKTRESFLGKINALFRGGKKIDASVLDELEEVLLTADVGVSLTM